MLSTEARNNLTLRLLGGLTTEEIARAFLTSEATVAQRIVRAKRTLGRAAVPFEVPYGPERAARLGSVLEVIYLVFNEGYAATAGDDWLRPALCEDAPRLARVLAGLMPQEPEAHGLAAPPSPVVELNRAVAVSMAEGPAAGLALVDTLAADSALKAYHLLPSVRGDLLVRMGRTDEARAEFVRAAELTRDERVRAMLLDRAGR